MKPTRSDALVFFGATGDLAYKKIFPALQELVTRGSLAMPVICVGRKDVPVEELRARAKKSIEEGGTFDERSFAKLAELLRYAKVDFDDPKSFASIKQATSDKMHPLHYVALPPETFADVAKSLASVGLAEGARLALEKPFGADLASAKALSQSLHASFPEEAIYRIDHFLGKESALNIVYFRAANPIIETLLRREHVERIEITMAESFGVEGRAKFYDAVGAVRDVVQNHLLQLVACITMDLPSERGHSALREARGGILRAMRSLTSRDIVRGQVRGYREEKDVARDSTTETFAAIRLFIDSPRWKDVPIFIRAGKAMATTATVANVVFRPPTAPVLEDCAAAPPNRLRFDLGKKSTIALDASVKKGGTAMRGDPRSLLLEHTDGGDDLLPYARILGDAIEGDPTLFAREDATFESWRVVEDVVKRGLTIHPYDRGSWGPAEAAGVAPAGGFSATITG